MEGVTKVTPLRHILSLENFCGVPTNGTQSSNPSQSIKPSLSNPPLSLALLYNLTKNIYYKYKFINN